MSDNKVFMNKDIFKDLTGRTVAYSVLKVSGTFVGASAFGIEFWKTVALAVIAGIMEVAEEISKNYLDDGKVSKRELNDSFSRLQQKDESGR